MWHVRHLWYLRDLRDLRNLRHLRNLRSKTISPHNMWADQTLLESREVLWKPSGQCGLQGSYLFRRQRLLQGTSLLRLPSKVCGQTSLDVIEDSIIQKSSLIYCTNEQDGCEIQWVHVQFFFHWNNFLTSKIR